MLDRAQKGWRIVELGDVGEELCQLELRLNASPNSPIELEHHVVSHDDRDVALLGADGPHRHVRGDRFQRRMRGEAQVA